MKRYALFTIVFGIQLAFAQSPIHKIIVSGSAKLSIDNAHSALIENTENYTIQNGALVIENADLKLSNVDTILKIIVSGNSDMEINENTNIKNLHITISGESKLRLNNTALDRLDVKISGNSLMELSGKCNTAQYSISGNSKIEADNFICKKTVCKNSGNSIAKLHVTDSLWVKNTGMASISHNDDVIFIDKVGLLSTLNKNLHKDASEKDTIKENCTEIYTRKYCLRKSESTTSFDIERVPAPYWSGVEIGYNGFVQNPFESTNSIAPATINQYILKWNSIHVGLNILQFDQKLNNKKTLYASTGAGFVWNNYKFETPFDLGFDQNILTSDIDIPQDNIKKSKLTMTWIRIPLFLSYVNQHKKSFFKTVSFGLMNDLRLTAHSKKVYKNDNKYVKDKVYGHFNTNQFRFSPRITIGTKYATIFGEYAITNLFKDNTALQLTGSTIIIAPQNIQNTKTFTIGVTLLGF